MCGIMGYVGCEDAEDIIIKGLHALEYRGYDSAGISISSEKGTFTVKCVGRVSSLEERLRKLKKIKGSCGIGHTRWATHGKPSEINAHPHSSNSLTLVHNGIIENYVELKNELTEVGYSFVSETDTECLAHLLDHCFLKRKDPISAIRQTVSRLKGSYAFAVIFDSYPNEIYALRKDNPLIIGYGDSGFFIASDIPAIIPYTKRVCRLGENEIVRLTADSCEIFSSDGRLKKAHFEAVEIEQLSIGKDGYESFMLKEMNEQPDAVRRTVLKRIDSFGLPDLSVDCIPDHVFEDLDSVEIIGCGSSVHSGMIGKRIIEELANVPVSVHIASEYRYGKRLHCGKTLAVFISQSGETADTLAALRCVKGECVTLGIVNVMGSSIASECDYTSLTNAGPEIAVATTKGYMTQASILALLGSRIALSKKSASTERITELCKEVSDHIPRLISDVLKYGNEAMTVAERLRYGDDAFFIGRGCDFCAAAEGSLKLKEISYIHSEAYSAGELKHGTLSLITEGTPVFAIATDPKLYMKTLSNALEVKSRGGFLILLCDEELNSAEFSADITVRLPHSDPLLSPMVAVAFLQSIAYKTAILRGYDADKPRNLAKSVTVE